MTFPRMKSGFGKFGTALIYDANLDQWSTVLIVSVLRPRPNPAIESRWSKLPLSWKFLRPFLGFSWFENMVSENFMNLSIISSANLDQALPELLTGALGAHKDPGLLTLP